MAGSITDGWWSGVSSSPSLPVESTVYRIGWVSESSDRRVPSDTPYWTTRRRRVGPVSSSRIRLTPATANSTCVPVGLSSISWWMSPTGASSGTLTGRQVLFSRSDIDCHQLPRTSGACDHWYAPRSLSVLPL